MQAEWAARAVVPAGRPQRGPASVTLIPACQNKVRTIV